MKHKIGRAVPRLAKRRPTRKRRHHLPHGSGSANPAVYGRGCPLISLRSAAHALAVEVLGKKLEQSQRNDNEGNPPRNARRANCACTKKGGEEMVGREWGGAGGGSKRKKYGTDRRAHHLVQSCLLSPHQIAQIDRSGPPPSILPASHEPQGGSSRN
ncbi:hypothetical protein DFP72DRAFT_847811 [Ephemerocybe angulata]|uniref:Uncharacterized protein n=1 Tax=Ephemerocybe angulata TaxID=980116 RepID=A0A8H6M8P5_9AGAR|nr:hypothetical protein DFP72DRAFT_847811 [Tulosesus angulatus]